VVDAQDGYVRGVHCQPERNDAACVQKQTALGTSETSESIDEAEQALSDFEKKWNDAYPPIALSWPNHWQCIIPFFDYPPEIRRII